MLGNAATVDKVSLPPDPFSRREMEGNKTTKQQKNKRTRQDRGKNYYNSIIAIIKIYMVGFVNGALNILKIY